MKKLYISILVLSLFLLACEKTESEKNTSKEITQEPELVSDTPGLAFMYQYVGQMEKGAGYNSVRAGISKDGFTIESFGVEVLDWIVSKSEADVYGDPVFSRLSNGNWAMTAWTGPEDSRGPGSLLYYEGTCPTVDDENVTVITASSDRGCKRVQTVTGAKSSEIFEAEDGNYIFHMSGGEIYLSHISDSENSTKELEKLCFLDEEIESISSLDYGESVLILSEEDILLSDSGIAQREDGTWVLFVKGIERDNGCQPNTVCELCKRSIYRTTSSDLVNWSELEKVVEMASVPEAANSADGKVWLYWQDFSAVCEEEDQSLGAIAPISASYETESFELSEPVQIEFSDEEFETNSKMHYATNGNPVLLPDLESQNDYEACMEMN